MTHQHIQNHTKKGFALLLGVIVAGVLITITYIMFSISLKQITLSTAGKNSQYALYAADTGIECGLYADSKIEDTFVTLSTVVDANGNSTLNLGVPSPKPTFYCNNSAVSYQVQNESGTVVNNVPHPEAIVSRFTVKYESPSEQCSVVTITKYKETTTANNVSTDKLKTKIESRGYNICTDIRPSDPLRVERGLEVYY